MASAWTWMLFTTILSLAQGTLRANAVCSKIVTNRIFSECQDLQSLGATYAWSFNNATNSIDFAFSEPMQDAGGWVAWGINPNGQRMEGTQALVAFGNNLGLTVKEYNVTAAVKQNFAPLRPTPISVKFSNVSAVMMSSSVVTIFGSFALAVGQSATINQVWNRGPSVDLFTLEIAPHEFNLANRQAAGRIDLSTGIASVAEPPHQQLKNTHSIINAVSWGILLPIGVMSARFLRPYAWADPLWFYLHITCQLTGYALGVAGWSLGLRLQKFATPIKYKHRNLGIAIFVLATLQVLAMVLRPKKDSKVRSYWNVYHHAVGYATIILIVVNIFEGLELLQPANKWKAAYISVVIVLGVVTVILEFVTWIAWLRRQSSSNKLGHHNDELKESKRALDTEEDV